MTRRLRSLDAFRGLTVAAMILVNSPGADEHGYWLLRHAGGDGVWPADLIFPAFLVIAGVAIPLAFAAQRVHGTSARELRAKALRRTRIIFGLGLLLNALPWFDWNVLRIPGVLQRIALCYGAAALLVIYLDARRQALVAAALLAGYAALLAWAPVPGGHAGVLEPGADLGAWLDRALMSGHLLHGSWDPEGLLSTVPAIATTMLGVLAGHWLLHARSAAQRLSGLLAGGAGALALGLLLGLWLPINKDLWTSSFALVTAGVALLGFAACFWLADVRGWLAWTPPLLVFGLNPLLAYFLSSLGTKLLYLIPIGDQTLQARLFDRCFAPLAAAPTAALLYALTYTGVWFALMAVLYRRGVFVSI
ncbi:MAG: heparan-alpha-glucosaminide N-acetyltransferase domain-containing protein [Deltaproteobacteria bacterium]|nr:heparan-alpha-glucosaminide N-acetyltransferase domain-containing protein [Deltaproteobacteria bacterium]